MDRVPGAPPYKEANRDPKIEYFNVPLMRNEEIIERPCDQRTITKRYTEESVKFIKANAKGPFFLYLPHTMPHIPLFRSKDFEGRSARGLYGDVVEELDWSTGQILRTLRELGLERKTLVIFTSDNGPWLGYKEHAFGDHAGSAGPFKDGKGSTWEGGLRVPAIAWWPGCIAPGGVSRELASTLDLFATAHALAGLPLPRDRVLDSHDLGPELLERRGTARDELLFYRGTQLMAVRLGPWKAHFCTQPAFGGEPTLHDPPLLYHLERDPGEQVDVAAEHPEVLARIADLVARHRAELQVAPSRLERRSDEDPGSAGD
jgi:arylsulfatase A-like enzyme